MAPVTWTQADVDALRGAVRTGVLTVSYDGPPRRQVTYQSLDQMRRLLAEMVAQVNTSAGTRKRFRLAATKKGL